MTEDSRGWTSRIAGFALAPQGPADEFSVTETIENLTLAEPDMQVLLSAQELRETETADPAPGQEALAARLRQAAVVQEQVCLELVASQQQQAKLVSAMQQLALAVQELAAKPAIPDHFPEMLLELSRKSDTIQRTLKDSFEEAEDTNRSRVLSAITELRTALLTEQLTSYDSLRRTFRNLIFVLFALLAGSIGVNVWLFLRQA